MVGLPWEQHVAFLDDRARARAIEERVRDGVRACAGHPAVLCYAVGNEIPAPIVRWHGRRRVERFLERLYVAAKEEDPGGLVTYVNYPTTEYLELPFLDFACFNVYLESTGSRSRPTSRGCRTSPATGRWSWPRSGSTAAATAWTSRPACSTGRSRPRSAAGCAGAFVFAWTDEWHRGGHDIEDWDFGLTTRDRRPKPALAAVQRGVRRGCRPCAAPTGPGSRSSSAPTTARRPSATASRACCSSTTRTTR